MKKWSGKKTIIEIICCMTIVVVITYQKLCTGTIDNAENEKMMEVFEEENDEMISSVQKTSTKEKKKKVKVSVMEFGEEEEEAGMNYTIISAKHKKFFDDNKKDIYRYIVRCHVKNFRHKEKLNLNEFEQCISVQVGDVEKKPTGDQKKKCLVYEEEADLVIEIDFNKDEIKDPDDFKVYYTTEEEEDDYINVFRSEYVNG